MKERRAFPRWETNCLIWYTISHDKETKVVLSKNISAIGTMFLAEEYLPCNTKLNLKLKIPLRLKSSNIEEYIELYGRVVRVKPTTGIPLYKTAIEFLKPSKKLNYCVLENT